MCLALKACSAFPALRSRAKQHPETSAIELRDDKNNLLYCDDGNPHTVDTYVKKMTEDNPSLRRQAQGADDDARVRDRQVPSFSREGPKIIRAPQGQKAQLQRLHAEDIMAGKVQIV